MRPVIVVSLATLLATACQAVPTPRVSAAGRSTPLILERNEGEQRVFRGWPGHPAPGGTFFLKVDPKNGGSSHLVFGTEDLAPGDSIGTHRHPGSDEILYIQSGTARVRLGGRARDVHGGATVYIPANTWIAVANTGRDPASLAFVFSAPGFEEFMREASVRPAEKNVPIGDAEEAALEKRHAHAVVYR